MVKIRLRRMGAKKAPYYRVVVADSRYPRDGRFIEEIGTYDPTVSPAKISIDADRAREWIKTGAQPTDTVRALLKKVDVLYIAQNLVEHPEQVSVTEVENGDELTLQLRVAPEDMGKVIGRQGRIAKEIRTVIRSYAQRTGAKVSVDIVD